MIYEKKADVNKHFLFERYTEKHAPAYAQMPHFHNSVEVYFVESGRYRVSVGGEVRELGEGDIAFVDPYTLHSSGRVDGCESFSVYVIVASNDYYGYVEWMKGQTLPPFFRVGDGWEKLIELVRLGFGFSERMNNDMRQGFVNLLLGTLHSYSGTVPRSVGARSSFSVEVVRYIGEHYTEGITLDRLAEKFGYEKTYLSRMIGRALGMNLREYLNRLRISAVMMMRNTRPNVPLYKIAEECGFGSENTFYRSLKQYS